MLQSTFREPGTSHSKIIQVEEASVTTKECERMSSIEVNWVKHGICSNQLPEKPELEKICTALADTAAAKAL